MEIKKKIMSIICQVRQNGELPIGDIDFSGLLVLMRT